jgi:hypothetical protein
LETSFYTLNQIGKLINSEYFLANLSSMS